MEASYGTISPMARRQVIVQLSDQILADLNALAAKDGVSRSEIIRQAVVAHVRDRTWEEWDRISNEAYARIPDDPALVASQDAATRALFRRLDEEERAAGFAPWEDSDDGPR